MAQVLNINWERRARELLRRLDKRRADGQFDFTIFVGNQKIHAEQNVLAAGSDYFNKMLSHDTKEKQKGELEMLEVDYESVKTCIDFIYGREVSVSPDKYEDLMLVADMMILDELCGAIEETMKENLSVKSFFSIREVAIKFKLTELEKKCHTFAEVNIESISKEEMFSGVEKLLIKELMKSSKVKVGHEKKLEILIKWVRSEENRKQYLLELLKCIDITAIRPTVGEYYIKNEPLINTDVDCLLHFSLAVVEATKPKEKILLFCESGNLRLLDPKLNNIGEQILLFCESGNLRLLDPKINNITDLAFVKPDLKDYSVVNFRGHIYVFGSDKSVHRLKYSEGGTWERMANMTEKHGIYPPATISSGFIYVIGGHYDLSAVVERFLPEENKWTRLQDKPQGIQYAELLTVGEYIYSFGGRVNSNYVSDVTRLDVSTLQWKNLSPMNKAKGYVSAAKWDGMIFVAGGYHKTRDNGFYNRAFEGYDPSADQWTVLPQMNIARSWFRLIPINGILYAVGGKKSSPNTIEKYDLMKNEWELLEVGDSDDLGIITSVVTFTSV